MFLYVDLGDIHLRLLGQLILSYRSFIYISHSIYFNYGWGSCPCLRPFSSLGHLKAMLSYANFHFHTISNLSSLESNLLFCLYAFCLKENSLI